MIDVFDYQYVNDDDAITSLTNFARMYSTSLEDGQMVSCYVYETDEQIKVVKFDDEFVVVSDKNYSMIRQVVVTLFKLNYSLLNA